MYSIPEKIIEVSRELRKNQTDSEKIFWNAVRNFKLGVKFLRQRPIYVFTENKTKHHRFIIADFYCRELRLIVEIDGNIHNLPEILLLDQEKESFLLSGGYIVLRFTNDEVHLNIGGIISKLKSFISSSSP